MRSRPEDLDEARLARLLAEAWHVTADRLRYLPVGFGSHHWEVVDARGARLFVTVDDHDQRGQGRAAGWDRLDRALTTAYRLEVEAALRFVVSPVPSDDGSVLRALTERYAVAVYPYRSGRPWPDAAAQTGADREAVAALLAQLHAATPSAQSCAMLDDLTLPDRADLERALDRLLLPWTGGPFGEPARQALASHERRVRALLSAYDDLAARVRAAGVPWVVTHGEPKPDNMLATDDGPVLVDWDTTMLAPAARDLWMVDDADGQVLARYVELTGRAVGRDELTLYRLGWDLADIASYLRWFSGPHRRTADTELAWSSLTATLGLERWSALL